MSNVKAFVEGKQYGKIIDPQRLAIGDKQRVSVPPTRLKKVVPTTTEQRPGISKFPTRPAALKQEPSGEREPNGFDTDAESLEDTTTMKILTEDSVHSRWSKEAGHQPLIDRYHSEECVSRPAQSIDPSAHFEGYSSESEGDGDQHTQNFTHLTNVYQSDEFARFRETNALDNEILHDFQYPLEPAAETGAVAFPDDQTREPRSNGLSTSKSRASILHHATPAFEPKTRLNCTQECEIPLQTNESQYMYDKERTFTKPLASQDEAPPDNSTRHLFNRALQFPIQRTGADPDPARTSTESRTVVKRAAHRNTAHNQTPLVRHSHDDSVSKLSEDNDKEEVAPSEVNHERPKRSRSLDHDLNRLATMTFQQLRSEGFDDAPTPNTSTTSPEFTGSFLRSKLEDLSVIRESADQNDQQLAIFDSLTIDQYGQSGEVLGQELGEIIAKLSSVRSQKRQIAVEFEIEIAKREHIVRSKAAALKKEKIVMTRQTEELTTGRPP